MKRERNRMPCLLIGKGSRPSAIFASDGERWNGLFPALLVGDFMWRAEDYANRELVMRRGQIIAIRRKGRSSQIQVVRFVLAALVVLGLLATLWWNWA